MFNILVAASLIQETEFRFQMVSGFMIHGSLMKSQRVSLKHRPPSLFPLHPFPIVFSKPSSFGISDISEPFQGLGTPSMMEVPVQPSNDIEPAAVACGRARVDLDGQATPMARRAARGWLLTCPKMCRGRWIGCGCGMLWYVVVCHCHNCI